MKNKGWIAFSTGIAGLFALKKYDNFKIKEIQNNAFVACDELRQLPLNVTEFPRKIMCFIGNTKYASSWYEEYVKVVFDRAAIDVDLFTTNDGIDSIRKRLENAQVFYSLPEKKVEKSWFTWSRQEPVDPKKELPAFNLPLYDPEIALVAVGPTPWRSILIGLENSPELKDYPKLGFVHFKDLTGFKYIPWRMLEYFFYRFKVEKCTRDALGIVLEKTRKLELSDAQLGSDDFIEYIPDPSSPDKQEELLLRVNAYDKLDPSLLNYHIYE